MKNIYEKILSPEELLDYATNMQAMCVADFDKLSEYESRIDELDKIIEERCSSWSNENYLVDQCKDNTFLFVLYVKDSETGVVIDAEGTFTNPFEAVERALELENEIKLGRS